MGEASPVRDYVNEHFRRFYPDDYATAWESAQSGRDVFRRYTGSASNIFPAIHLGDGSRLSVQGHFGAYSWPRDDFAEEGYWQVEILGPNLRELDNYCDGPVGDQWLYGYVPVQVINELIDAHGGLSAAHHPIPGRSVMSGGRYRNRCAVSSYPAGHPYACNDCDPCMLGSAPELWCKTCGGDLWIQDRPCYNCDATGFEPTLTDDPVQS